MSILQRIANETTHSDAYLDGFDLAAGGDVVRCDVTRGQIPGTVYLDGTVRTGKGAPHKPYVTLDLDENSVLRYSCTCSDYYSAGDMCKHCVALTMHYLDEAGIEPLPGSSLDGRTPARRPTVPSDPKVARLLNSIMAMQLAQSETARQAQRRAQGPDDVPVDVEVTLMPSIKTHSYYYQAPLSSSATTWLLKLRLRRGKVGYIVKNMDQLAVAYQTAGELSHGKNLTFVHAPDAFTERGRAVLDLIVRVVESQHALFNSRDKYSDVGKGTEIKDLPISCADVVDLLDIMQGSSITFDPKERYRVISRGRYGYSFEGPEDKPIKIDVLEGDPIIDTAANPTQDGGLDLTLPRILDCFAAGDRFYVIDAGHAWRCSPEFSNAAAAVFSALLPVRTVHVGPADLPGFCRTALPALRACTHLTAPEDLDKLAPPIPEFSFRVGVEDGVVFCDPTVTYAGEVLSIYDPQQAGQPSRDIVAEYRAADAVRAYFPNGDAAELPWFAEDDDEQLYLLMTDGLKELAEMGEVLLSERLRGIEARTSPQVNVHATVKSGLLNLEVNASGLAPKDLMAFLASYKRKQRYLRLSNGDIMKLDGSVRALNDLAEGLGIDEAELVGGAVGLPSNRTLFVDALLRKAQGVRLSRNDAFRAVVRDFETFGDADIETPTCMRDVLRPYQEEGMRWLGTLERFGFGGILADDMGLGKTIQMIAHIVARKEAVGVDAPTPGTTLIVCPASLVYNWVAEIERFAPQLDAVAVVGTKRKRWDAIAAGSAHDVLVTSYDLLKRDVEAYAAQHYARVVLDEAQYIKNASTQAAKAAKCLVSDVRFALTGTPIENRLAELWSIFDFLMPGILGTAESFTKRYADAVEAQEEGAARRLQLMVSPFILRRLKGDVLADLPEKNESVVYARMEGEQDMLYKTNQDRLALQIAHELPEEFKKNKLAVLAELTKLRQICCDPHLYYEDYTGGSAKLDTSMELVRSALEGGHSVLLFSQFTSMLDIISKRLDAEKIDHLVLTGATSKEERVRLVTRFQAGEVNVFLISLKAGGVGLNLTAADVVIHYDPWWNYAAQNQATDRAHRIGQNREVSVFKLIAKDTIEERIMGMQESKRDLAESVLGGDEIRASALDRDGVLALLGEGAG